VFITSLISLNWIDDNWISHNLACRALPVSVLGYQPFPLPLPPVYPDIHLFIIQHSFNPIMVYIRQRNLEKLHEYKYSGVDHSLVSKYILKPFYTNVAIKCFPMSMAWVAACRIIAPLPLTVLQAKSGTGASLLPINPAHFYQITLTGFSFVVVNFLTLLWYNPTLDTDCPPWVYASWAVGLFLYQTFDAVDGTQARRTHQSGPLGELFDHGKSVEDWSRL
jgi:CDP-alcohol phosphatidyltransferase